MKCAPALQRPPPSASFARWTCDETLVASLWDAQLLGQRGKPIAGVGDGYDFGAAHSGGVSASLGQVVPDEEPEIVLHGEWNGRRVLGSTLLVLKRQGERLRVIFNVDLYESVTDVPEDENGEADYDAATSTDTTCEVELLADGRVRKRCREEGAAGKSASKKAQSKTEVLRWDPGAFRFAP